MHDVENILIIINHRWITSLLEHLKIENPNLWLIKLFGAIINETTFRDGRVYCKFRAE
jgi:hypothetical protein